MRRGGGRRLTTSAYGARCIPCFPADLEADAALRDLAVAAGFSCETGTCLIVGTPVPTLLVGCGDPVDLSEHVVRDAFGAAGPELAHLAHVLVDLSTSVQTSVDPASAARAAAEGLALGSYSLGRHRPTARPPTEWTLNGDSAGWQERLDIAAAINAVRDVSNEPANIMTPRALADHFVALGENSQLAVTVRDEAWLREAGAGGILAIGAESTERTLMVEIVHEGDGGEVDLCLVGKGVTFDSGGLSLKSPAGIMLMQLDMTGAATMAHAMTLISNVAPSLHVHGYFPLVENLPGPNATRPGDIIVTRDGTTVEVLNTDFEGRVIMADALAFAGESKPRHIIDMATLTAGAPNALGPRMAALLGAGAAPDLVTQAATAAAEEVWPLPMPEYMMPTIRSRVADLKNFPYEPTARASTAAMFLREFVETGSSWAHLDMAGPGWTDKAYVVNPEGATGWGVRLLLELFALIEAERPSKHSA